MTDATPKGVSKPDEISEEQKAAVADIRKEVLKERTEGIQELATKHNESREAELQEAGLQDKVEPDPKDEAQPPEKQDKKVDTKPDSEDDIEILKVDGVDTEVPKSKILEMGKRAIQKDMAADARLEKATKILSDAQETAEQLKASQPSSQDVDDTASFDNEALAKTLVDGNVDEVAEAIGKIMGTGRQEEMATQAAEMQPDQVFNMVQSALQMKEAMDLFQNTPESGGYGDLYPDETMRQMVFDKESELAKIDNPEPPVERLKQAAESVREWRNGIIKQSGGNVVDFGGRESKKAEAISTPNSAGGRMPENTDSQPKTEADKRRETLAKMSRSRGQHLD